MHTIRTRRLMREFCGPDTGSMSPMDRETVMPVSLAIGVVVVVLLAGCQQSSVRLPAGLVEPASVATDNNELTDWFSKAHAQAAKGSSADQSLDMSY